MSPIYIYSDLRSASELRRNMQSYEARRCLDFHVHVSPNRPHHQPRVDRRLQARIYVGEYPRRIEPNINSRWYWPSIPRRVVQNILLLKMGVLCQARSWSSCIDDPLFFRLVCSMM
jgi:hypothetical protein